MKTRDELVEEIVGEFRDEFHEEFRNADYLCGGCGKCEACLLRIKPLEQFLHSALLKISDASMDAVEVEEREEKFGQGGEAIYNFAWNSARTASQEKRRKWTK